MKKSTVVFLTVACVCGLICQHIVYAADDFFDVINFRTQIRSEEPNFNIVEFNPVLYGVKMTAAWRDSNKDNDWGVGEVLIEPIRFYDQKGNFVFHSPDGLNREQLQNWAEENADKILGLVFPGTISQVTGSSDHSIMTQDLFNERLLKKVVPVEQAEGVLLMKNDFKAKVEYLSMDVNDDSGKAGSVMLGYVRNFSGGSEFGVLVPYRYGTLDDDINSKTHFVGLDLYYKLPVYNVNRTTWNVGADLIGSLYYLSSDAIKHAGNYTYGAGVFTSIVQGFEFGGALSLGVDYKYSKSRLSASLVDTDNVFVEKAIDYVNNLDPVHNISYGFNFGVPLGRQFALNLEAVRTHFISDDIPSYYDSQTTAALVASYYPADVFELSLGVRHTFELENISVTGVMLGAVYKF